MKAAADATDDEGDFCPYAGCKKWVPLRFAERHLWACRRRAIAELRRKRMKIVEARWTESMNILVISCDCGSRFEHRADRWRVKCRCGRGANLGDLRKGYVNESYSDGVKRGEDIDKKGGAGA